MNSRVRRAFGAALLTVGIVGAPATASEAPVVDLAGPNVVRYRANAVLENARRVVVQGRRTADGGCSFSVTERAAPDAPAVRGQELAFDVDTCRSLLEIGVPATPAAPKDDLVQIDDTWAPDANDHVDAPYAVDVMPAVEAGEAIPLAASSRSRALHTWFRDPPGIHVNDATNTVTWAPSSSCAFPRGSTAKAAALYEWFKPTGWTFRGRSWSPSFNCTAVTSRSWDIKFRNRVFCAAVGGNIFLLFPTNTELNNQIRGLPGGSFDYTYEWSKDGGCAFLLTFEFEVFVP